MADFKKGDRVKVADDATESCGISGPVLRTMRGKVCRVSPPTIGSFGDVRVRDSEGNTAYVNPKFLTLITDEPEPTDDAPVLVEVEDLSTLPYGQEITLESKNDTSRIPGSFVSQSDDAFSVMLGGTDVSSFFRRAWRVLVEKPKVELPTEDGWYLDAYDLPWTLTGDSWRNINGFTYKPVDVESCAPFTRLVPEGSERNQAIRDVRDFVKKDGGYGSAVFIEEQFPEAFSDAG